MTLGTLTEGNRPDPFGTRRSFCGAHLPVISGVYGPKPKSSPPLRTGVNRRFQFNLCSPVWSPGCMLFSTQSKYSASTLALFFSQLCFSLCSTIQIINTATFLVLSCQNLVYSMWNICASFSSHDFALPQLVLLLYWICMLIRRNIHKSLN